MKKSFKIKLILVISTLLIIIIGASSIFFLSSYKPTELSKEYLLDSKTVDVTEHKKYISFKPEKNETKTGLIIYPGAKVEPEAYSVLANKISSFGYDVIIASMPFNFAIFNKDIADTIIQDYPNIENWVISGHSLGGVMASKYASENSNIDGIVFLASYPMADEIKNSNLDVLSISASNDNVINKENLINSKNNLPTNSEFLEIDGGNHGQFGSYGEQKGDGIATISNEEQTDIIVKAIVELLNNIN